jgi:16S rRNA (cytidine1402-2'-O)-methyltransferase
MNDTINTGTLYIVATPIGNLKDFTFRAVEVLSAVDIIAAEDTRHSQKLLQHYGISTACMAVHEHNERAATEKLLTRLSEGQDIALISDAGTPLISDPGYQLVKTVRASNIRVVPIPGPNAAIVALCAAGIATDRFCFQGFLPAKSTARRQEFEQLLAETRSMIFYETPHRLLACIKDMLQVFGPSRQLVLARELTKLHESIHCERLENMPDWIQANANRSKGEMVLLLEGGSAELDVDEETENRVLKLLLAELSTKKAALLTAQITGGKKNRLYQRALEIEGKT